MGKYHFIAIGGIGMSGLAKYLLEDGHTVTGSDIQDSKYIDALRKLGAEVNVGHKEENLPDDADAVIVSTAIKDSNPVSNQETFEREYAPLLQIRDAYPKMIIARTKHPKYTYEGIEVCDIVFLSKGISNSS